jgi:hypothetical protein
LKNAQSEIWQDFCNKSHFITAQLIFSNSTTRYAGDTEQLEGEPHGEPQTAKYDY